jgi:hypothetical protein
MLMPVAVLIVLLLGAIAVDLASVRLAHQDLMDVASSAANDAVTSSLDQTAFRIDGSYVFDLGRAQESLDRTLERHHLLDRVTWRSIAPGPDPDELTVELELPVRYFFAKTISSANHGPTVRVRASAHALQR